MPVITAEDTQPRPFDQWYSGHLPASKGAALLLIHIPSESLNSGSGKERLPFKRKRSGRRNNSL